MLFTRHLLGNT